MIMYDDIKIYLENMRTSDYAESTIIAYEVHLRHYYSYCRYKCIDYKVISIREVLEYKTIVSKDYALSSINIKFSVIKSFYNFMIDIGEVEKNPIRESLYIRYNRQNPKPLSKSDLALFYSFIETKQQHIRLGYYILFDTGIRISELINLKKSDIRIIDDRVFLYIEKGKRKKSRIVPIFSQDVISELLAYAEGNFDNTLFFYSARAFQLYAEEFSNKFNINFTTHMTRHTFATTKLNEGMRIDILQKILGHEDIRTTMYYALTDETEILKLGGKI